MLTTDDTHAGAPRRIVHKTRGSGHGAITRLMSPSDLGQLLKPFVFLDIFGGDRAVRRSMGEMPLHPHSGIATITVITEGHMRFSDPAAGSGEIGYGGVEWMRAGGGIWHGKEMSFGDVDHISGFQLWIALSPELENTEPVSAYLEAKDMVRVGPAHVILGSHEGVQSVVEAPAGINYLLVTLRPGERWTYLPPKGHGLAWLSLSKGALHGSGGVVDAGEMAVFEPGEQAITLEATGEGDSIFVLGSAVPHPHPLHLGYYSVHTSPEALAAGENRIAELRQRMLGAGDRTTAAGTIPVFR